MAEYTREQQAENRRKWIAALRSGEYGQIQGHMDDTQGSYCCLGVAAKVLGKTYGSKLHGISLAAYPEVVDSLGLVTGHGDYSLQGKNTCLITDNDEHGKSFAEIADIIESEPDGLFTEKLLTQTTEQAL